MANWWNTDIRPFPGVDQVLDATRPWPWANLEYVYGEHFLEHLLLDEAIDFLTHAGNSLRGGGIIRLSTPNLDWVIHTHYPQVTDARKRRVLDTLRTNRAFHGWGHHFLYSEEMLDFTLTEMQFDFVRFCAYGESLDPELTGLERHGNYSIAHGKPSVVIVEAARGETPIKASHNLAAIAEDEFLRFLRSGH